MGPTPKRDTCPSCFQPVGPADFLCPDCELILDVSKAGQSGQTDGSVVRRLLEPPQRGVPGARPHREKVKSSTGATRVLTLGPELEGVPIVVATLSRKLGQLSELEAFVVSVIDGQADCPTLAKKAALSPLELRVVLRTLNDKQIVDFADAPVTDEDLAMPLLEAELAVEVAPAPPPAVAPAKAPPSAAVAARTKAPLPPLSPSAPVAARAPVPPPPPPPTPPEAARAPTPPPSPRRPQPLKRPAQGVPAYPSRPPTAPPVVKGSGPAAPPGESTDPRIAYTGEANRKLLDALKQVKRADAPTGGPRPDSPQRVADVLARDSLQVALRMEQGGRLDEAIRFLERAIAQSPDAATLYNRLGIIVLRERADHPRAEQLMRKALELDPDNAVYQANLRKVVQRQAVRTGK